jgi:predicted RNA-binding protein with PUA-like domain
MNVNRSYWLLKTEAHEYSWSDLSRESGEIWDGVKAPGAIKNIKKMKPGDLTFIYHSGRERSIIGLAEIISLPYLDPHSGEMVFKLRALEKLPKGISLKQIKDSGMFADWDLVRLPRLSVVPVNQVQWDTILKWAYDALPGSDSSLKSIPIKPGTK